MSVSSLEGGCLCGSVRFRVTADEPEVCCCHCRSCQRASGAPYVAWATIPVGGFTSTGREIRTCATSPGVSRGFCGDCGTSLSYAHRDRPGEIDVAVAAFDTPGVLVPRFHIWLADRLPWVTPDGDLPQYDGWRRDG